jgi:chromosomal replication initiator protein
MATNSSEANDQMTSPATITPWELIKQAIKAQLPNQEYTTWVAPLECTNVSANQLFIKAPNILFYQRIHDSYLPLIEKIKAELGLDQYFVQFDTLNPIEGVDEESEACDYAVTSSSSVGFSDDTKPTMPKQNHEGHLNPLYTFENFVKGSSNQFALSTCQAVASQPGKSYNPLFLCGSSGLGKTHLLHAVGNEVIRRNPAANVAYITSERFMNEMIYCIRFGKTMEFRQKYRSCDVLLIDDVQFISGGKKATQEEFFHTFNSLYGAKKQIVMTSDVLPQSIPDIEDRLRNRFQWGLIADIQPPDVEHRIAILIRKADALGIKLDHDVAEYIARHKKKDIRELEGAVLRLRAFSEFDDVPITLSLAQSIFQDFFVAEAPKKLSVEDIQKTVAEHFKIKIADLKSKKKHAAIAHPRQIAMFLARKLTPASLPELGQKFGGKDHTTVLHNVKKIESAIVSNLDLRAVVDSLQRNLEHLS